MQARTRMGLIVGTIGLVLNICVSGFLGVCGPVVSLLAGAVAGFLAAQQEKPFTKNEGARAGATAGGIAGGLVIIGQLIGGLGAAALLQAAGAETIFGAVPSGMDPATQLGYFAGGAGMALCLGIVGALLAAGAGAGAGYLATQDRPSIPPSSPDNIITP